MRVTENLLSGMSLTGLADLRRQHLKAAEQATTGLRVNRPSDDAAAASRTTRAERLRQQNESTQKALQAGRTDLELAESTLAQASDMMKRAQELAMTAANGSASAADRATAADELAGIRDSLRGLANTKGARGYIFAGAQTKTEPFDGSFAFQGDTYEHTIRSGPSSEVTVSASGSRAFTAAGGRDIFQDLNDLEAAMRANDQAGISSRLGALDQGHQQITLERSRTGVQLTRIAQSETILEDSSYLLDSQKAQLVGADPVETLTSLVNLEQSLQRTLTVTQRLLSLDAFTLMR